MVRLNTKLLKEASNGLNKTLCEILVCPLSKQPMRFCEETNSLISDAIGVSFPIKDGIPCLVPKDGKILDLEDETKPEADVESSAKNLKGQPRIKEAIQVSCELIEPIVDLKHRDSLVESTAESNTNEGEFCCICLSTYNEEEEEKEETTLLPCKHRFHKECVERWFSACKKTCPVCRFSMEEGKCIYGGELLTEEMVIYFSSFHAAGF